MDKTNERKKKNWRGSLWELYYNFSDGITDGLLNNIIFIYSVGVAIAKFTLKFWIS
jgi:hypothetical protein